MKARVYALLGIAIVIVTSALVYPIILNLLGRLQHEHDMTMIMVTHSREVIGLADRLLTIRDCKLVELESD